MEITFYDVKTRAKVQVPVTACKRIKITKTNKDGTLQIRYALKGSYEGRTVTKFVSKVDYDTIQAPEE